MIFQRAAAPLAGPMPGNGSARSLVTGHTADGPAGRQGLGRSPPDSSL